MHAVPADPHRRRSPFPGMDPYLERHWRTVHAGLIEKSTDALNALLPPDLVARPEELIGIGGGGEEPGVIVPDVRTFETGDGGTTTATLTRTATRSAAVGPLRLELLNQTLVKPRRVRVTQAEGERLVTVIEFVSPSNKRGDGRRDFLHKRRRLLAAGVNVVEVDLTRRGAWRRLFDGMRLPAQAGATYRSAAFVPRRGGGFVPWLHPMPLAEPLPIVSIPLRPDDELARLALQPPVDAIYAGRRFGRTIDYDAPCDPPLKGADAEFARQLLAAGSAS